MTSVCGIYYFPQNEELKFYVTLSHIHCLLKSIHSEVPVSSLSSTFLMLLTCVYFQYSFALDLLHIHYFVSQPQFFVIISD